MKKILVKFAKAGERYITDSGIEIELCANPKAAAQGRLEQWVGRDHQIFAWLIVDGKRSKQYVRLPAIVEVFNPRPKRKRNRRDDDTPLWRGWSLKHVDLMDDLLGLAASNGCWEKEGPHFIRVGKDWKTMLAIYKGGLIGFHSRPSGRLGEYPIFQNRIGESYLFHKIFLPGVYVLDQWDDLRADVDAYLKTTVSSRQESRG